LIHDQARAHEIYGLTVGSTNPPAFIVAATDDPQVPVMEAVKTYTAWKQANIPVELHVFQTGGHGFGALPRHKGSDQWLELFDHWLRENGFGGTERVRRAVSTTALER
jgi:acetyl esterase/lipase